MPELSFSLTAAGSPYNLLKIVRGDQTTGVTIQGSATALTRTMSSTHEIDIRSDAGNGVKKLFFGGPNVNSTGNGYPLAAGESHLWRGASPDGEGEFLGDKYIAVDTNATIVHVSWSSRIKF